MSHYDYFFCSSWVVPPLLGIAYIVLGGILPGLFQQLIDKVGRQTTIKTILSVPKLRLRALTAVATTALIVLLSEFLETHPYVTDNLLPLDRPEAHLVVMFGAALIQWALLDGTSAAFLASALTSIAGPLAELPFVANNVWVYLDQASDYFPLLNIDSSLCRFLLGDNYQNLALSSITGPCYFAVTMDAIALGRWFDSSTSTEDK